MNRRFAAATKATPPAMAKPTRLVVVQVRQTLQHAATIGAWSDAPVNNREHPHLGPLKHLAQSLAPVGSRSGSLRAVRGIGAEDGQVSRESPHLGQRSLRRRGRAGGRRGRRRSGSATAVPGSAARRAGRGRAWRPNGSIARWSAPGLVVGHEGEGGAPASPAPGRAACRARARRSACTPPDGRRRRRR